MKKRISTLVLALVLIFSVSATAATPRYVNPINCSPTLTLSRSGATCIVDISSFSSGLTVSGTVTLYRDNKYLTSWSVDSLYFSETYTPIAKGKYRMDFNITVKGPSGSDRLTGSEEGTY
ncbi:hypothetical protein CE91St41_38070 [Oscillospiraceae bacterium]|nr:hypothetical protein CE91St40_38050 [Oscillospiraceae bacterium]BDF76918.1 hypothetical protein CE91St41_38070 [Oscillospiraceae bacterium]